MCLNHIKYSISIETYIYLQTYYDHRDYYYNKTVLKLLI